jgi:suppressor for copper-sensitivity B
MAKNLSTMNLIDKASTKYKNLFLGLICILISFTLFIILITSSSADELGSSEWDKTEHTALRLISATKTAGDTELLLFGLHFKLKPGWKIYWRSPGDAGFPPEPNWNLSENVKSTFLRWPVPVRFSILGLETLGYKKEVVLPIKVKRLDNTKPLRLGGNITYLACKNICIPYDAKISIKLDIGDESPSKFAYLINKFELTVPGDGKQHKISLESAETWSKGNDTWLRIKASSISPFRAPDLFPEGPPIVTFSKPIVTLASKGRKAFFKIRVFGLDELNDQIGNTLKNRELTLTLVDGKRSAEIKLKVYKAEAILKGYNSNSGSTLLVILGLAILGGFILNLMPCVLPVLSIKLLSVINHSESEEKRIRLSFLASAGGIVFTFVALGIIVIVLKASGMTIGWGIQFQQPSFLIAMTILMVTFALNLWGLFEFRLPLWISQLSTRVENIHGMSGDFFQGILATLLATPCSAPFLGTAIGFALARTWVEISIVFLALGFGMAIPYFLIATFPSLVTLLPKPGHWMLLIRRFLGLALIASWIWLLYVLANNIGTTGSIVVGGLTIFAAGLLMFGRRAYIGIAAIIVLAFQTPRLLGELPGEATNNNLSIKSSYSNTYDIDNLWKAFDKTAIVELVAQGKTVFVDITADWCLTCQVNKRLVLDSKSILQVLKGKNVIAMQADWTRPNPNISTYISEYGRYGIPFNAIYGPGSPNGIVLSELLSKNEVLDALSRASKTPKISKKRLTQ